MGMNEKLTAEARESQPLSLTFKSGRFPKAQYYLDRH